MTKAELIEKYGIEWYNNFKKICNERSKKLYKNDPVYREHHKDISIKSHKKRYQNKPELREYCKTYNKVYHKNRWNNDPEYRESKLIRNKSIYVEDGRIDLINNYALAVADNFEGWDIHHKLELHPDGSIRFTKQSLIKLDLYYNRPPAELIWIKRSEHLRMHNKNRTGMKYLKAN